MVNEEKVVKIAYCGINCESCKLYKATITSDEELKTEIANEWGVLYNRTLNTSNLNCHGCKSEIVYEACKHCDIKSCNQKKNIQSCNACLEYSACERIKKFIKWQRDNNTGVELVVY